MYKTSQLNFDPLTSGVDLEESGASEGPIDMTEGYYNTGTAILLTIYCQWQTLKH